MTDPLCAKCNGIAEHAPDCEDRLLYLRPPALRFTGDEAEQAWRSWGFNCGPGALCGVLQLRPEQVRLVPWSEGTPTAEIVSASFEGPITVVTFRANGRLFTLKVPSADAPLQGRASIVLIGTGHVIPTA